MSSVGVGVAEEESEEEEEAVAAAAETTTARRREGAVVSLFFGSVTKIPVRKESEEPPLENARSEGRRRLGERGGGWKEQEGGSRSKKRVSRSKKTQSSFSSLSFFEEVEMALSTLAVCEIERVRR